MKTAYVQFSRILLVLCLVWYGPVVAAGTGDADGMMTMEICVNGAAQTVRVDVGGAPVESAGVCCDCIGCCLMAGDAPQMRGVQRILNTFDMPLNFNLSGTSLTRIPNTRPLPRAPPVAHIALMTNHDVIAPDHYDPGQHMHSNGRPLSKDASA